MTTQLDEYITFEPPGGSLEGYRFRVGWAIFTGINGEDPSLAGFIAGHEDRAWACSASQDADGEPLFFDSYVLPALLLEDGRVWVANTTEVLTHRELIELLRKHGKAHENFPELDE